jgi:hypothetical protein
MVYAFFSCIDKRFQVQPSAKKAASLIEKETLKKRISNIE